MIPAFTEEGVLPPGRHPATEIEVERRFVMTFPASMTRKDLYDGWMRRREELLDLVSVVAEWLDGSFVTAKSDAGDIDLVTLIRQDVINALGLEDRKGLFKLVAGDHPRIAFGCHSFLMVVCDEGDANHDNYLWARGYWDRWWSMHGDSPDTKGYVEVRGLTND